MADAFSAEVYALSHAVSLAADLGLTRVEFQVDSQLLAEGMNFMKADSSPYASVIEYTKYQLKMWFVEHVITVLSSQCKFCST